ncbi:hypothetical protein BDR05DRAFT_1006716 [Suillus weaverae]|nr:hypothetical protein BDR05DRAFT_1006716 [Suillus weaverae]
MEFAPSSPPPSPPHSSSPAPTNSSSATRVEPSLFDFKFPKQTNNLNRDSPRWMTSDIGSISDTGSPLVPLSPVDEVPKPHEAKQSILYKVPKSPNVKRSTSYRHILKSPSQRGKPGLKSHPRNGKSYTKIFASPSRRGQYLRERMSQKHIPYASRPAPLELRFAARVSGQGCRPEFTVEEINEREEAISRGFSHLSLATLYQLFKSKLAGHEAARQRLVTTTWELEASEWYTTFLDGLYRENKDHLLFSDEELSRIRNVFSDSASVPIRSTFGLIRLPDQVARAHYRSFVIL